MTQNEPTNVVVAGGGVAAIEAILALHDAAGDRVSITLVAPQEDFLYRPMSVGEPFALGHPLRRAHAAQGSRTCAEPAVRPPD